MRQVLMGLIIVSLAVMLGFVVHFGVCCRAAASQPTPAKKETAKVVVPAPKPLPQVVPDQVKETAVPDQVRVQRSCQVSKSCDCQKAPRVTLFERLHKCRCSCDACKPKVETKVVRVHKCQKGCGCGCGSNVDVRVRVH
jgi:hypothetical protein